jgi:hypothetical protein
MPRARARGPSLSHSSSRLAVPPLPVGPSRREPRAKPLRLALACVNKHQKMGFTSFGKEFPALLTGDTPCATFIAEPSREFGW